MGFVMSTIFLKKLPARSMAYVMPLILSIIMSCIVSLISTLKSTGFSGFELPIWLGALGIILGSGLSCIAVDPALGAQADGLNCRNTLITAQ